MSAVVDASVVVAALVDSGPTGEWAETVLENTALAAPELVLVEAGNILRRLELSGEISASEAGAAYTDLLAIDLELFPFARFSERVWELRHNLTCYDAWYVALAETLNRPLITLDRRLSRSNGPICQILVPPQSANE